MVGLSERCWMVLVVLESLCQLKWGTGRINTLTFVVMLHDGIKFRSLKSEMHLYTELYLIFYFTLDIAY